MNTHSIFSHFQNLKSAMLATMVLALFLILCVMGIESSTAQSPQKAERELEDEIPKHLPIKIKVKHLNNEKWARDLEVEVKNTSNKPIYYLFLILSLPEVKSESNRRMGFQLIYGRSELVSFTEPLQAQDAPIRPGESYTLKIPEQFSLGWEQFTAKRGLSKTEPKKVKIRFGHLNFGDGTGFTATDGSPINIHRQQSLKGSCVEDKNKSIVSANMLLSRPSDSLRQSLTFFLPANFLPVKLSAADIASSSSEVTFSAVDVCGCQV